MTVSSDSTAEVGIPRLRSADRGAHSQQLWGVRDLTRRPLPAAHRPIGPPSLPICWQELSPRGGLMVQASRQDTVMPRRSQLSGLRSSLAGGREKGQYACVTGL